MLSTPAMRPVFQQTSVVGTLVSNAQHRRGCGSVDVWRCGTSAAAALIGLRRLLAQVERDIEANKRHAGGPLELSFGVGSEREYMYLMSPVAAKDTAQGWRLAPLRTVERGVTTVPQLKAAAEELTQRLDELTELMQLRLQMVMDRRSRLNETLGNVLKKIAEARQEIISNMK